MPTFRHEGDSRWSLGGNRFGTKGRFDEPERISFNRVKPNAPQPLKHPPPMYS